MSFVSTVSSVKSDRVWAYFGAPEILKVSTCSRVAAQMVISAPAVKNMIKENTKLNFLGKFELHFGSDLSIGMLRRVLNRIQTGENAVVSINAETGRVMLDIGSAFNDNEAYLASDVQPVVDEEPYNEEIFKHLNLVSFDEYDDFNPRHPLPREMGSHRRGDSYFSSDVEMLANEPKLKFDIQNLNVASMALENPDEPSPQQSNLKNKFLSKTKNIIPGKGLSTPPPHRGAANRRAKQQLAGSDEDDNN
jgi:hypothetical protein